MTRLNNLLVPRPIWILILLFSMQNSAKGIAKTETEEKQIQDEHAQPETAVEGSFAVGSSKNDDPNPKPLAKKTFASTEGTGVGNKEVEDSQSRSNNQNGSGESSKQTQESDHSWDKQKFKEKSKADTDRRTSVFELFGIPNPYKNLNQEKGESSKGPNP